MRKHNRKFATRFGSAAVDKDCPKLSHSIVNSKSFQLAANGLLGGMFRRAGITHRG